MQTPIQLQSSEDQEFLKNLLNLLNSPGHAQQSLNSSHSDLNCSVLLNSSESNDASTQPRLFDRLVLDGSSTSASKTTNSDTKALINQNILEQLTAIEKRLQALINPKAEVLELNTMS